MSAGKHDDRCPTCGKFVPFDADGYYDTEPGGTDGYDPVMAYCNEECARRKSPPSIREDEAIALASRIVRP